MNANVEKADGPKGATHLILRRLEPLSTPYLLLDLHSKPNERIMVGQGPGDDMRGMHPASRLTIL